MCSRKCAAITFLVLGVVLLIAGIIVAVLGSFKSLVENKIKKVGIVYGRMCALIYL